MKKIEISIIEKTEGGNGELNTKVEDMSTFEVIAVLEAVKTQIIYHQIKMTKITANQIIIEDGSDKV